MSKTTLHLLILALALILAQVIVFNHICLFGVAVPMAFIYLIIRLPLTMPVYQVLTSGFLLGLAVDMFSDTPGLNAMACTIIAMMRRWTLNLYFKREDDLTNPEPSLRTLGTAVYLKYILTLTFVYCTVIYLIEGLTFFYPIKLAESILGSTVLTSVIILGIDSITNKNREKRL